MRRAWLLALLLPLALLRPPLRQDWPGAEWPHYVGDATWYSFPTSAITKSGERFNPNAMTAAIDLSLWPKYAQRNLRVCQYGECIEVRVNDTGYLLEEGVILDLTPRAFRTLCGDLAMGRCSVRVYAK